MKSKHLIPLISYIVLNLSPVVTLEGQTGRMDLPYIIEVKKNITNVKTINLSSIGKELTYIPLETTPECMIQEISRIEFSDEYIFIKDFKKLLQFDRSGKFIRKIGSEGRGPSEYSTLFDFSIDEQEKEISIISTSDHKLMIFSFEGVFKNSYKLSFRPMQMIPKDKNSIIYHLANVPGGNDPSWIITNRKGITLVSIKNNLKRISQPGLVVPYTPLYLYGNSAHFMEYGIDTLYYFKGNQKMPYAIFSMGDLKMDIDPLITEAMVKNHEFLTDKIWAASINENSGYIFIEFIKGITSSKLNAIYDKRAGIVTFLKENTFKNDLGGGIGFWPKQIINDNILVDYVDAFDLLKKIIPSTLRSRISETSNPVLMILK